MEAEQLRGNPSSLQTFLATGRLQCARKEWKCLYRLNCVCVFRFGVKTRYLRGTRSSSGMALIMSCHIISVVIALMHKTLISFDVNIFKNLHINRGTWNISYYLKEKLITS